MAHLDTMHAARAGYGSVAHGKDHGVAPVQGNDLRAGLHARSLFRERERAAGEILVRLGKQDRNLKRKNVGTVDVLMQCVPVAGFVAKE